MKEERKIKILYLIYSLNAGGIESLCTNILNNINLEKYKIDFLVIKEPQIEQFYDQAVYNKKMEIIPVGDLRHGALRKYTSVRKAIYHILKKNNYDVVHIHSGHIDKFPDAIMAKICKVPKIILHSHNGKLTRDTKFYYLRCFMQKIIKQIYPLVVTDYFTCSDLASKWAFPKRIVQKGKVIQIQNGIDTEKFCYSEELRRKYRKNLGIEKNTFLIGHIGRFSEQKNHEFLIDVFNEISIKNKNSKLLLIGMGELEEKIKNKVKECKLENNVIFYGTTDEIPGMLAAMDVFLFPSRFEGLPVVGIEAQAMALHVVASDKISQNVKITKYWESISLDTPIDIWVNDILKYKDGYVRKDMKSEIKAAGFDIRDTTEILSEIYAECMIN